MNMIENSKENELENIKILPDGWELKRLSSVSKIIMGQSPPSSSYNLDRIGLPFLQGNTEFGYKYPKPEKYCTRPLKIADKNSVLLSIRAPVGEVNITNQTVCIGRGLSAIIPKNDEDRDFVYYYLQSATQDLNKLSAGSTFEAITGKDLANFPIAYPKDEERHHIATILSTVDAAIAATDEVIAKTEDLKRGLMQDLLTKGIDEEGRVRSEETHAFCEKGGMRVPVEWDVAKLENAIRIYDCRHYTPHYVEKGYPIIRPQNISCGNLDISSSNYVSDEDYKILTEKHRPRYGDIVYSRNASMGIAVYVDIHEQFCIGQDMVIMTKSSSNPHFVYYCLHSKNIASQIKRLSSGSTFHRINLKDIKNLLIPNPSIDEQDSIVRILSTIETRAKSEKIYRARLQTLKKGLMQDLLTGRKRVPLNGGDAHGA